MCHPLQIPHVYSIHNKSNDNFIHEYCLVNCNWLLWQQSLTVLNHGYYTSGKNFIKITSVGMGAAKSNETR